MISIFIVRKKVIFMWAAFCMHVIFNVIKYTIITIIIYRIGTKKLLLCSVLFHNIDGGYIISQLLLLLWLLFVGNSEQPRPETATRIYLIIEKGITDNYFQEIYHLPYMKTKESLIIDILF